MSPLSCRQVEELLDDYGRGDLQPDRREAVELHLAGCERCREAAELWTGFTAALDGADLDPLPPLVERRIVVAAADASTAASGERAPRIRRIVGIAAAAAVAAGVALFLALSPGDEAAPAGDSTVADEAGEPDEPAVADQGSLTGDAAGATGQGRQLIEVDDVTRLWIEEGSAVRVERLEERLARFRLEAGRVLAEIGPHPEGFRFVVVTPSGEVEAKGTIFAVEVDRRGVERARVMRGVVEVRTRDEAAGAEPVRFLVRAGESGTVGDTAPSPLAPEELERDVCLLRGCTPAGEPVRVASTEPEAPAASEACDPATGEPPAPADPISPRAAPHPAGSAKGARPNGEAATAASTGSGASGPAAPSAASADDWEVETLVSLALSQRKAGMYPMAAETYRRLIRDHAATGAARNALVSLGQLELVELGRPQEALALFERYLARAPSGLLAEEARLGRVRAYARMGRSQDVVGAASDYLRLHLGGYAGAEVMRLRADAKRKLGDCLGAIEDYRQVQGLWPTSPQNKKAEAGLAACRAEP